MEIVFPQFLAVLLFLKFLTVNSQFYYRNISPFEAIQSLSSCITPKAGYGIRCSVYSLGTIIESTCLHINVLRIVGEYDTIRLICSAPDALDFRYHGIQPTEAIRVEWYKNVEPSTNGNISEFGVDVQIRSVEALYQFYTNKSKGQPRQDYPRSGNFLFRSIYRNDAELNIFIYLEDSGIPSFLRNFKTRITLIDSTLHVPCTLSHYGRNFSAEFRDKSGAVKKVEFVQSRDTFQGLLLKVTEGTDYNHGTYTCTWPGNSGHDSDQLTLEFPQPAATANFRFGLDGPITSTKGPSIRYYPKEANGQVQIEIGCKVDELEAPTQLIAIEAENFAMMNLKREFTFPKFVNRSYTAISKSTVGELTFEIRLDRKFYTRYGGATYCKAGNNLEVVEFAVPFVGEVSKRIYDTEWPFFNRRTSDIHIHYDLAIVGDTDTHLRNELYDEAKHTFVCRFIVAIVVKPAIWTSIWRNGSSVEEKVDYNWTGPIQDTSQFTMTMHRDLVGINCSATFYYADFWRNISTPLTVKSGEKPRIESSSDDLVLRVGAVNQGVTCRATGRPTPKLSWFKGGNQLFTSLTANGTLLHQIQKVASSHGGDYICRAENIYGTDEKVFKYVVHGDETSNWLILVGIPITVFLLTLVGAIVYVRFFREEQVGLTRSEVEEFLAGERNAVRNSSAYAHEFAHQTPYNKSFELSDNKFQIDTTDILGAGAYGVVFKGIVDGRPVAVKTTKKNADKAYLKALLSELKIMIYLGYHENIVELIGASTKDLEKGSVYIFVPFCGLGNLEKYLRGNRHLFDEGMETDYRNIDHDHGAFSFKDLLSWSIQIADGMEYLASKKVIHGDLAARNVLLTEKKQARITDFGLSRQIYGYASYVKKNQEPLPWRWMALESLRDLSFSTLSDIWSYGVVLWEIFSLGEVPYPGMAWTLDFVDELENGLRMSRPKRTPDYIYVNILYLCWHKVPGQRPSFTKIRQVFDAFQRLYLTADENAWIVKDDTNGESSPKYSPDQPIQVDNTSTSVNVYTNRS